MSGFYTHKVYSLEQNEGHSLTELNILLTYQIKQYEKRAQFKILLSCYVSFIHTVDVCLAPGRYHN